MIELLGTRVAGASQIYVDDVFSTYLYTGNGSTQTITNGIDLAGKGGLVWIKARSIGYSHMLVDTARGVDKQLASQSTQGYTTPDDMASFTATGFSLDYQAGDGNASGQTFVSWTFRKAAKFFDQSTATVSGGVDATVSFANLTTLGMVIVKRTDSTGSWYVWHRSLTAGKLLYLEQTAAEATLGEITVSGTTVTLEGGVIANGDYIVYGFAHDTGTDGIIQCGSTTGGQVTLGWEPQFVLIKKSSGTGNWTIYDNMRGMDVTSQTALYPNTSGAEVGGNAEVTINSTGFVAEGSGWTKVYIAIRRPNKPPTTGTQVYAGSLASSSGTYTATAGFPVDMSISSGRTGTDKHYLHSRLLGLKYLLTQSTNAEATTTLEFDSNTSIVWEGLTGDQSNYMNWMFRRAPGVFDVVCYDGNGSYGRTISHNLGAIPELMIFKCRSAARAWPVYVSGIGNTKNLLLNATDAAAIDDYFANTTPTASVFSVGSNTIINDATPLTYVAYLFATKAGISKVGSYTGNGTNQTINCGFSGGARFILIKRTDSTGDWYVWDSARGIVAGNDPHLSLNTTAAEVTTDDSIDPDSTGFIVNQDAATNINVNTATYIYLAFA